MCAHIPEIAPKLQASAICDSLSCNKPPENMTFVGQHLDFHAAPSVPFVHTDAASQEKKTNMAQSQSHKHLTLNILLALQLKKQHFSLSVDHLLLCAN